MLFDEEDLNHPKIAPFTREVAAELGLEPAFVDFVFAPNKPDCFAFWCEPAEHGWSIAVPDEWEHAYPIWSTNADQTLLLRSGSKHTFAQGRHDHPDVTPLAHTSQGLLARLFIIFWENEMDDEALREAAAACGFRHLDDVLEFEREHNHDEDFIGARARFIAGIDARNAQHTSR